MDVREKLASHLYRNALQVAPGAITLARLSHPLGATWDIGPGLIMTTYGDQTRTFTTDGTFGDLLNDLGSVGFEAVEVDSAFLSVPAAALLHGFGSTSSSDENRLQLFSSTLWTLLDAYGLEVDEAEKNLVEALDQLYLDTADAEILDVWGGYFGVAREAHELDPDYYAHIVRETFRPRVNRYAIEAAIRDDTGLLVSLVEPHRKILRLSVSPLSGDHHLQDGTFYTWNVFQPIYHSAMTLEQRERVLAIIERNRPAGCLIVGAEVAPPTGYVEGDFGDTVASAITLVDTLGVLPFEPSLLSATLYLSNQRDRPDAQFVWTQSGEVFVSTVVDSELGLFTPRSWEGEWDSSTWNTPSVYAVVTQNSA